ncbi:NAD(P)/FAD-dependent oxidoreductase [Reyranella sp.]|jgi:cation diffusion facilitator CzcD-associated flavoprotein CzcO|uniref:flavin-containing monooxygenase n=1 Tax=Reyranella sp. TaxID=1929291 RepID=UPI000BDDB987|nr:NAD(P)/FAD-dependent oxidoreductase [Reyranella sp.]OYY39499.1 MAG: FAD-containing monooxygenase EthA [Rhodospirillales bacterium 35-66-84]OYZ92935.1 MAG: FAD-containing monooxygenase EthA [Rhodospirillales bacterium 24-66-33]OZB24374.1 MAG: FAD-containing monooxygenase EthA [Rhodospirillales bacterium 39-66-50]HQS14562.1 NAD(P)/FAD-dependent oxidoreductase [Reyranella sp.]HQT12524.1 NAD(P)/FAD-dependent oxidoreductase [Reyranella sp.]
MDTIVGPAPQSRTATEHFDVLIVGAGLSGIGAAWHLQKNCPGERYAILEGRAASGGTWDLFRYPGVRSDSDMYTLGYRFRPWKDAKAIADGPSILSYIREVASDHGIDRHIRYGHRVVGASWSTPDARWTVEIDRGGERAFISCGFLWMCSGYYRYEAGYLPEFPGIDGFKGRVVHPQHWPQDLDYAGKKVVVIGSGATAVTVVPSMAETAGHVTMLQRSPTYVVARPAQDPFANKMRRRLPLKLAYMATRWKNVLMGMYFYQMCKRKPEKVKSLILGGVRQMLGPEYDVATHFTPKYNPWDQRLCLVPDADLFRAIRKKKASVVTDTIETFTETGIKLKSGAELEADVVVTATGLVVQPLGGAKFVVDGKPVKPSDTMIYKGMMYSDVPNLVSVFGYTNASWTLKADLVCEYVCRLLNYMDRKGFTKAVPHNSDPTLTEEPWVNFSSGYIQRALPHQPKQGSKRPWKLYQNYVLDLITLRHGSLRDKAMVFSK